MASECSHEILLTECSCGVVEMLSEYSSSTRKLLSRLARKSGCFFRSYDLLDWSTLILSGNKTHLLICLSYEP